MPISEVSERDEMVLYQNPVVSGFAPDPSVVFVDEVFYLVTSSFHLFPGIPIYASRDLRSWSLVGNAINRVNQIDLSEATTHAFPLDTGHIMVASAGLWAPTIRHHKGRFYIICTNCTRGGEAFLTQNFYIYTDDIMSNEWSDPIFVDFKGIDPSLFFDIDDRVYFQGSWELTRERQPTCTIKQFEIDITTGKPLSETQEIWTGAAKYDTEGPHIYRKDGYYYLVVAEGGTFEHHMLSIARSRSIWGPFESYEYNPILTSDLKNEFVQNTGHGELFHDASGAWWAVVLGVRESEGGRSPIGRESFLTPVDWPKGGWPTIDQPRMTFVRPAVASKISRQDSPLSSPSDKPTATAASYEDVYIRNPELKNILRLPDGSIELRSSAENLSVARGSCSFLGRRQRDMTCKTEVLLHIDGRNRGTELHAGLAVYKDCHRHGAIFFNHRDSKVWVITVNKSNHTGSTIAWSDKLLDKATVQLQIRATEKEYQFLYRSPTEDTWTNVKSVDALEMTARDFTGTIFGVYASGQRSGVGKNVRFNDFEIVPS